MAENVVLQFGYFGLFIISFLAATLFPFSSEAVVILMPSLGYNVWLVLIFATVGNFLGTLANYLLGKWGGDFLLARYIRVDPKKLRKAYILYGRWGAPILFFSWAPFIGDPLAVISGMFKVKLPIFIFWVLLGKVLRYLAVLGVGSWVFGSI